MINKFAIFIIKNIVNYKCYHQQELVRQSRTYSVKLFCLLNTPLKRYHLMNIVKI